MIINQIEGDLLKGLTRNEVQAVAHCANCFNTMNSGVAAYIKKWYPEAYAADCETLRGDQSKLGTFTFGEAHGYTIFNIYGQYNFGYDGRRYLEYDMFRKGLEGVRNYMIINGIKSLGLPYNIGCARAGGKWEEVYKIITETFEKTNLTINIYKYDKG